MEFLMILGLLALVVVLASIIETLIEWLIAPIFEIQKIKNAINAEVKKVIFHWMAVLISFGVLAFYQLDIIYLFTQFMEIQSDTLSQVTWLGIALTAVLVGLGSSRLHEWIQKWFAKVQTIDELPG